MWWKVLGWIVAGMLLLAVLPYVLLGAFLFLCGWGLVSMYRNGRERDAQLAWHADVQHAWVMSGDPRGWYGP